MKEQSMTTELNVCVKALRFISNYEFKWLFVAGVPNKWLIYGSCAEFLRHLLL